MVHSTKSESSRVISWSVLAIQFHLPTNK